MVIGILIGLAVGLLVGVGWHLVRSAHASSGTRLAEARLADARVTVAEQTAELRALSDSAARAEQARAVAQSELEQLRRHEAEWAGRAEEDLERLTGTFATLSREAL